MSDGPIPFTPKDGPHDFNVMRDKITIFPDAISREIFEGLHDAQKVVFVSVGPGETRVTVINDEGHCISAWIAVFGWSSLCEISIDHNGDDLRATNISMITRALHGTLRLYGEIVDTSAYKTKAAAHFKGALSHILDQTVGDAREYDKIILAAPEWLQDVLKGSLNIRPHIAPEIQDL